MLIVGKCDEAAEGRARMLAYSSFAFVRRHWRMKRTMKTKCAEFLREIMESRGKEACRQPQGFLRGYFEEGYVANDRKIREGRPSCEAQRDVDQGGVASVRVWIGDDGSDSRDDEYGKLRYLQMSEEKQGGHAIQMEDETWQKVQTMKKTWISDLLIYKHH
jgi:hypothetical protein